MMFHRKRNEDLMERLNTLKSKGHSADGEYIITTMTKAVLHHNGHVHWSPPAIFKTSCEIDVRYFPFDQQECFMKFGSWTYDGFQIDLKHLDQQPGYDRVEIGIDLREYYPSVEWDIMKVPANRNEKFYPCCREPFPDIYFNITLRRKTLFYTVNLIIPCVALEYLSVLVFYLPVYSGEKVCLCISILLSQTMFFLLISEIMPSTSLAVPLLGKYLLFTMLLVGISVLVTIIVLNIHYRKPSTHRMAPWVRSVSFRSSLILYAFRNAKFLINATLHFFLLVLPMLRDLLLFSVIKASLPGVHTSFTALPINASAKEWQWKSGRLW
ncbi:Neurotransmitter-gated ion-channel transmembrane region [Halocaridina rubra]|uniref:Neurotransmitter-gated ion-channel transmembrane region n=1 Tax=Halocaridina rubra TaxID=373956 RepID=A0AAN8X1H7_HALRR